jgi:asparagine N-glycosylation enzyme membrane subunit Stt3
MEDYTNLQGQTGLEVLFALLLTLVTAYVYLSCRSHARRSEAAPAKPVVASPGILRNISVAERENAALPSRGRALWRKHKSSISDWLAPLIVWSVVMWTLLAVVGMLLGES